MARILTVRATADKQPVAPGVELASRLAGMTGRAVGAHYAAISSAAVSIIRRNVRQRKYDLAQVVQTLLTKIRNDEARSAKLNI